MPYFACQNVSAVGLPGKSCDHLLVRVRTPARWEMARAALAENRAESWCTASFASHRGFSYTLTNLPVTGGWPVLGRIHTRVRVTDQLRGQQTEETNDIPLDLIVTTDAALHAYLSSGLVLGGDFLHYAQKLPSRGLNGRPTWVLDMTSVGCQNVTPPTLQLSP
jgi:hypothetical protein